MSTDASVCENCGGESFHHTVECFAPLTHAELDARVRSLYAVGGLYEIVARNVEFDNRPQCVGEPTGVRPPWADEVRCVCAEPLREGDIVEPCPIHGWSTQ